VKLHWEALKEMSGMMRAALYHLLPLDAREFNNKNSKQRISKWKLVRITLQMRRA